MTAIESILERAVQKKRRCEQEIMSLKDWCARISFKNYLYSAYLELLLMLLSQYLSNLGTTSLAVSSGFIGHKSVISKGFLYPSHMSLSNHENVNLERAEHLSSGAGLSCTTKFKKTFKTDFLTYNGATLFSKR